MMLKALLVSADEKIQRLVRRVVSDLEINIDCCTDAESAIQKLTRWRYESIILDFGDARGARNVLRAARVAPANKRAILVSLVPAGSAVTQAFAEGCHFAMHRTESSERLKANFRAVRALMKRERRRNLRLPIELKVVCEFSDQRLECSSSDLGEGGMAIRILQNVVLPPNFFVSFSLANSGLLRVGGETAWKSGDGLTGIRFVETPHEAKEALKQWLTRNSEEAVADEDSSVRCELTDLSPAVCYLATTAPFPRNTRLSIRMRVAHHDLRAEGIVRVTHPEVGMGVEFLLETPEQVSRVEALIQTLCENPGERPEFSVEPEEMDAQNVNSAVEPNSDDPLHALFIHQADMPVEAFQLELRKQRRGAAVAGDEIEILSM